MAQADGTVYINTAIETDGFKAGGKEIEAACRRMSQQVNNIGKTAKLALQKQTDAFVKQNQLYAQQERKVQSLKAKLKELENQQMPTDEFAEIGKQIDNDTAKLNRLLKSQEDFLATGGRTNSSAYKKRQMQIEELRNSIRYAKGEQDDLLSSGKAYKTPDTRGTKQKLASEEEKLMQMHNKLGTSYENLKNKVDSFAKSTKKLISVSKILNGISNSLSSGFKKIAFYIKKAASSMLDMNKNTKKTRMTLGRMLGMSLLFSTVFRALSTVTNGIKEGFQNLAQYSGSANASISSLMSALTQLKNSFATAFSPILSVVAPILTSFINMLSKAITYVGMFFAALTGAKSFTKAKAVQQDYAAGLGDTANAAGNAADAQKDLNEATDDYLTGLDEIHKFESKKDTSGSGSGGSGSGGGVSIGDMFEEVPINSTISGLADKIKDAIRREDWKGLGEMIADGINAGMKKVYNALNWKKVGKKITKFVDAFTDTLNSLVDHIDWDFMGRTVGTGINTLVKTLNRLIEKIDWKNLGRKFARGVNGLLDEVNWRELGNLIGNKFMIAWDIFSGFVEDLDWGKLGVSIAEGLNGIFEKIDFGTISHTLATGINGAFTSLKNFALTFSWKEFADNVVNGINTFIRETNWRENGEALETFLNNFLNTLVDIARGTDWEKFGEGIGQFLSEIDWATHFVQLVTVLTDVLGGIWKGLGETSAGKFIQAIVIFKIGTKLMPFVDSIIKFFTGTTVTEKLSGAFKTLFSKGITQGAESAAASGAMDTAAGSLSLAASGAAGLATAALAGKLAFDIKGELDGSKKSAREAEAAFYAVQLACYYLSQEGKITEQQVHNMSLEFYDVSDMSSFQTALQRVQTDLEESGISVGDFRKVLEKAMNAEELQAIIDQGIGGGAKLTEEYVDAMLEYINSGVEMAGTSGENIANSTSASYSTKLNALKQPTSEITKSFVNEGVKSPAESELGISGTKSSVFEGYGETVSKSFSNGADSQKSTVWNRMSSILKGITGSFSNLGKDMESKGKNAVSSLGGGIGNNSRIAVNQMKSLLNKMNSIFSNLSNTYQKFGSELPNGLSKGISSSNSMNVMINAIQSMINKLNSIGKMMYNVGQNIAQNLANGIKSVHIPVPTISSSGSKRYSIGNASFTVPNFKVSYLASGAVIPPNKEFMAVLGDQKHGTNIETPEALLRKIVREESGKNNGNGGRYTFIGQVNRRTLFEEVIEEAKLRQMMSGHNPFELG